MVDRQGEFPIGDDELSDTTERTTYRLVPLDTTLLTNPAVVRAIAGIAIGLTVLVWPNRTDRILGRLIGIALVWLAGSTIHIALKRRPRAWVSVAGALVAGAAGAFLVVTPDQSAAFLGRLIGAGVVAVAVRRFAHGAQRREAGWLWVVPLVAPLMAGALLLIFPEEVLATATSVAAVGWVALSLLVVVVSLDARSEGTTTYRGAWEVAADWIRERPKSADARQTLYDKILYEGPTAQRRVIRFFVLMGFAALIASMGVLTDSTAVVIGAMLIAPLMTPLMGMAISLVMGWPNRLTRSVTIALAGIVFAIGIGALLGLVAPTVINTTTNSQIVGRSSPTMLDLITAVAAGSAGAYGLSRPDVSDSLPGVAIAISLVPPLSVVGIAYSQADWSAGNGALLLFTTNMVAILIMGGLTFIVTGVTPIARVAENQHRVRTWLGAVSIAAVVVVGALLLNGAQVASNLFDQSRTESSVEDWLRDAPLHRMVSADIDDDVVTAVVVGPSVGLPDVQLLAEDLTDALDRDISADVRLIVEERITSQGGG